MAQLFEKMESAKRRKTIYLTAFRNTLLPEHPDADLCFAIYRLILPEVRSRARAHVPAARSTRPTLQCPAQARALPPPNTP